MNSMTISELKNWLKANKSVISNKSLKVQTPFVSQSFNTLKAFGEFILSIETQCSSASIYSYSTDGVTFSSLDKDFSVLENESVKAIQFTFGGMLNEKQIQNIASLKTLRSKNPRKY